MREGAGWPAPERCLPTDEDRRPRRGPDRRVDRARRARARRGRGGRSASAAIPAGLRRALELGAIDRAADSVAEAVDGAELCFACAPVGALPELVRAALDAAGPGLRRDRRGLDQAGPARAAIDDERFVGGHPIAGRRDGGRGARARRHVPGRRLVPDAAAALGRPAVRAAAPLRGGRRRAAGGGRPGHPRPASWPCSATSRTCSPTCSPPRRPARLADHGEALRQVGPELPRHDPRGRRQHGHLDRHLPSQPRRDRRGDRRVPARAGARRAAARRRRRGRLERPRPRRPARAARVRRGGRARCTSCASPSRTAPVSSPRWRSSSARRE